jgi:hypothetical protein
MFNVVRIFFILFLLGTSACTQSSKLASSDPKRVLTDYISKSFAVKGIEDRVELVSFMTGEVKARLAGWSEEQFRGAFVESKREFIKLSYRETKEISANEAQITYELTYLEHSKNRNSQGAKAGKPSPDSESKVTTKKLCQMLLVDGKWYIADVRNIKELVEFKNELSLP